MSEKDVDEYCSEHCVLVHNLPIESSDSSLAIHFQNPAQSGGGDIVENGGIIRISEKEAIVTFLDKQVARSVLARPDQRLLSNGAEQQTLIKVVQCPKETENMYWKSKADKSDFTIDDSSRQTYSKSLMDQPIPQNWLSRDGYQQQQVQTADDIHYQQHVIPPGTISSAHQNIHVGHRLNNSNMHNYTATLHRAQQHEPAMGLWDISHNMPQEITGSSPVHPKTGMQEDCVCPPGFVMPYPYRPQHPGLQHGETVAMGYVATNVQNAPGDQYNFGKNNQSQRFDHPVKAQLVAIGHKLSLENQEKMVEKANLQKKSNEQALLVDLENESHILPPSAETDEKRVLEVRGFDPTLHDDNIRYFFENKKRSGGGKIEEFQRSKENNVVLITFKDPSDVDSVLQREKVELRGRQLYVSVFQPPTEVLHEPNTIKATGFHATTLEESIWTFFELPMYGGGDIDSLFYYTDTSTAIITFTDPEVAQRLAEKGNVMLEDAEIDISLYEHNVGDDIPDVSSMTFGLSSVKVIGLKSSTHEDTVKDYFENRQSNGGEVKHVDMVSTGTAIVSFVDPKVALQVVHSNHCLEGADLSVCFYTPEEVAINTTNTSEPVNKTIQVTGLGKGISDDTLRYFFENRRKSGGGTVEDIEVLKEKDVAFITFESSEVAERVVKLGELRLEKKKLKVSMVLSEKDTMNKEAASEEFTPNVREESCTISVTGFNSITTEDAIENFFSNRRHSGGGAVTSFNFQAGVATITFQDSKTTRRVLNNPNLLLDDYILEAKLVAPPRPDRKLPVDPYCILVSEISDNTSKDNLENFLEAKSNCEPDHVQFGSEPGCALVKFKEVPDIDKLHSACQKKTLANSFLKIRQFHMTDCIQVHDLPPNCTTDVVENYFTIPRKSGGGDVEHVEAIDETVALVYFKDHTVVSSVLGQKQHTIGNKSIRVSTYYKDLGICHPDHDASKPCVRIPIEHIVAPLPQKEFQFIASTAHKEKLDMEVREHYGEIQWETSSYENLKIKCTLNQKTSNVRNLAKVWQSAVDETVKNCFAQYKTVTLNPLQESWENVIKEMKASIDTSDESTIWVDLDALACELYLTGTEKAVTTMSAQIRHIITEVEEDLKKAKQVIKEPVSTLKEYQLQYLLAAKFPATLRQHFKNMSVSIDLKKQLIEFNGLPSDIKEAKVKMYEITHGFVDHRFRSSSEVCELMFKRECRAHVVNKLNASNIIAVWVRTAHEEVTVCATDINEAKKAAVILQSEIVESCIPVPVQSLGVFQGEGWVTLKEQQETQYNGMLEIILSKDHSEIKVVGIDDATKNVREIVDDFIQENTILQKWLPVNNGKVRWLIDHRSREMSKIVSDNSHYSVNISPKTSEVDKDTGFTIFGTAIGIHVAEKKLNELRGKILAATHKINKPGMAEFFSQKRAGQNELNQIERNHNCTVETCFESDVMESLDNDSFVVNNPVPTTKLVGHMLRPDGRKLMVYEDDLTKHTVDVIVNAANGNLQHAGGLARAISVAGGPEIQKDSDKIILRKGTLLEGQVTATKPGNITTCKKIVHAVGPVWHGGRRGEDIRLFEAVSNCLEETQKDSLRSIAMPALSSGVFGYPLDESTLIIVQAVDEFFQNNPNSSITEIHFVDPTSRTTDAFLKAIEGVFGADKVQRSGAAATVHSTHHSMRVPRVQEFVSTHPAPVSTGYHSVGSNTLSTSNGIRVSMKKGMLSKETVDVIVNTTGQELNLSSGAVATDLARVAGPQLQQECSRVAPNGLKYGEVIETPGYNLRCNAVLHGACKGWKGPSGDAENILRKYVKHCLQKAQQQGHSSIAYPAIGTGNLGIPCDVVAKSMFDEVLKFAKQIRGHNNLKDVRFIVYNKDAASISAFEDEIKRLSTVSGGATPGRHDKPAGRRFVPVTAETIGASAAAHSDSGHFGNLSGDAGSVMIMVGNVKVQVQHGDITQETTEAIVNSTDAKLSLDNGAVERAIVRAGGQEIVHACKALGGTTAGVAVTHAGRLSCKKIIHVDAGSSDWKKITKKVLNVADKEKLESVAFPLLGTGQFRQDVSKVANQMLDGIHEFSKKAGSIKLVKITIFQPEMIPQFVAVLHEKTGKKSKGFWEKAKNLFFGPSDDDYLPLHEDVPSKPFIKIPKEITLKLFGDNQMKLQQAISCIEECCKEQVKDIIIDNSSSKHGQVLDKLTDDEFSRIQALDQQKNVQITIEKGFRLRRIRIQGRTEDIYDVKDKVEAICASIREKDKIQEQADLTANHIRWMYLDNNQGFIEYSKLANLVIEKAYQKKDSEVYFEEGDVDCVIEFAKLNERLLDKPYDPPTEVKRLDLSLGLDIPGTWTKVSSGDEVDVVVLPPASTEYQNVEKEFLKTQPVNNLLQISRIQNARMWNTYSIHKNHLENNNPNGTKNERVLYHGTSGDIVPKINRQGFNRSFCGQNAVLYGKGVYFARDAAYSARSQYAKPDLNGTQHVYQCRVLTGEMAVGNQNMLEPPAKDPNDPTILFDSTVDKVRNPKIFVVFRDSQAYPEYLIEFN